MAQADAVRAEEVLSLAPTEVLLTDPDTATFNDTTHLVKVGGQLPEPRHQHGPDKGSDGKPDLAWGARGHGEWSADPTIEPGKTVPRERARAAVAIEETSKWKTAKPPAEGQPTPHPESTGENHPTPSGPPGA